MIFKIWLAPLHGITYFNFRNCFIKHFHGIDCAIAPFIAAQPKDKINPKKLPDLFPKNNDDLHIIPQLMGNIPKNIKETIVILQETFGYKQFNWNIGCPMNQIVRKKRGCGIMPFPDMVEEVVSVVCGETTAKFSLKMRLGLHSDEEGLQILQRLSPYPIDFLCIHPRMGIQQYEGTVDLDIFEMFYKMTNHSIVYNGDIHNVDFFMYLQKRFPKIENWMLGRGILKNPFLAEKILSNMDVEIRRDLPLPSTRFISFYNDYSKILIELKNEKIALSLLKELWHYFAIFWKLNTLELQQLLRTNDYQEFNKMIQKLTNDKKKDICST